MCKGQGRGQQKSRRKALLGAYSKHLSERIKIKQNSLWVEGMAGKSMLEVYREHKESRTSAVHLYDNSRGSALLALARAGSLPTRVHKSLFKNYPEPTCNRCGVYEETMEHVIFECNDHHHTTDDLCNRLGLKKEINRPAVEATKRLLEKWERGNQWTR